MSEFEVVRSNVDGWDVRRAGESQALSNHPTREQAEEAVRRHGSEGKEVDVREDVFSEGPEEDLDVKSTLITSTAVLVGVIGLMVAAALIVALTNFGG